MSNGQKEKLWSGRFATATDQLVERFTASVDFDKRLYRHDITGSVVHARMLGRAGILSEQEVAAIVAGLEEIRADIERGEFPWSAALEDVHMNIEARLTERIGEAGKKLHTGRSRNDQVATDVRLFLRSEIDVTDAGLREFMLTLLDVAQREADTIMPGFTHLQVAQPVTFGHHMMAWFEMLRRDRERLVDCRRRTNVLPLGAAALAGTSYPIDREWVAAELGFDAVAANSLDAVSDRDFAIEFVAVAALCMVHLSRMAEELVLWSSAQFEFVDLPDAYCTGSSIMPQKKNPDVPELVRGKSGRVVGHLMALLTLMKGQPLAYNRDNQEDKIPLFESVDTLQQSLAALQGVIANLEVRRDRTRASALRGFATATDLADYRVNRGVAFRDAHEAVGKAVRYALDQGQDLADLTLDELRVFAPAVADDVYAVLTLEGSVSARDLIGGTAPQQVRAAVREARDKLR